GNYMPVVDVEFFEDIYMMHSIQVEINDDLLCFSLFQGTVFILN
ncbi:hypothetical protein CEXT_694001, partial [Caerostris extrusa]